MIVLSNKLLLVGRLRMQKNVGLRSQFLTDPSSSAAASAACKLNWLTLVVVDSPVEFLQNCSNPKMASSTKVIKTEIRSEPKQPKRFEKKKNMLAVPNEDRLTAWRRKRSASRLSRVHPDDIREQIIRQGVEPGMSDAFDYFRAHAVRAFCQARAMPRGKMKRLKVLAGRIYHLLTKESAYGPNTQHLDDFRAAQKLERMLDGRPRDEANFRSRFSGLRSESTKSEAR
ncbi:hypothetical protein NLM27_43230 [Bradyrhizobium sp. CCGB12]|uniref:hypothetical protein n=1 Tax=Bradyrhizobium sp. CCGB12 TaxID=2949632 RepID=UPI0020B2D216|nr:hypothetical protein [Bradyrhizobium sp. CCGB12]MCP3395504.1 hypothetical protein [Bradyrhizobium sp. CCGB12]